MNIKEFAEIMKILIEKYGKNKYPDETIRLYYENFRHVDKNIFRKAVARVCAEEKHAPVYNDIIKAVNNETSYNARDEEKKEIENQIKKEISDFKQIYEKISQAVGEQAINRYYEAWCKATLGDCWQYGIEEENLGNQVFMRIAMKDLALNNYNAKRTIEKIKKF